MFIKKKNDLKYKQIFFEIYNAFPERFHFLDIDPFHSQVTNSKQFVFNTTIKKSN